MTCRELIVAFFDSSYDTSVEIGSIQANPSGAVNDRLVSTHYSILQRSPGVVYCHYQHGPGPQAGSKQSLMWVADITEFL